MKRSLLDEKIPIGLRWLLRAHDVRHVHDLDWTGLSNGDLSQQRKRLISAS